MKKKLLLDSLTDKRRREIAARLRAPNKLDGAMHYDSDVSLLLGIIDELQALLEVKKPVAVPVVIIPKRRAQGKGRKL